VAVDIEKGSITHMCCCQVLNEFTRELVNNLDWVKNTFEELRFGKNLRTDNLDRVKNTFEELSFGKDL